MDDCYNIEDIRRRARSVLPRGLFEFVDRGSEDEAAFRAIDAGFDRLKLKPRVLVDVSSCTTEASFFGRASTMPVAVAPTGAAGLLWYDGEISVARAAKSAGIPFTLSTASIVSMERVAAEAGGRLWFQLYMWPERSMSFELVDRARACGYEALMVTVDTAVQPNREYNSRNGFSLPMRITRRNLMDVAAHPSWFLRVFARYLVRSGIPRFQNYPESLQRSLAASDRNIRVPRNDSLTWDDMKELRRRWKGPLIVKGILRADDALQALNAGADAVVVSCHGGRTLDAALAPIDALPRVLDAVASRMEVYVDSGFTRGTRVAKALSLGATGVLVGRTPLWGVASAGEVGARHALYILQQELSRVLGQCGCPNVAALRDDIIDMEGK